MLNISELMRSSGSTLTIAIAVSVFAFVVIYTVWSYISGKNKPPRKRGKELPAKKSLDADFEKLILNKDGSLKTYDKDFDDIARQINEANAEEQESISGPDSIGQDLLDDEDDIDLLQEITKDSVNRKLATLEDLPMSTSSEQQQAFDEEFFEMSKIDDFNDDDSIKGQLMNLSPEMRAIVFSNLLDRKDF